MTTRFKICPHAERAGEEMVEVWIGDRFFGAIYPGERDGELRFVSKHLVAATLDERHPPAVDIFLSLGGTRQ